MNSAVQQESSSASRGSRRDWKGLRYKIFPVEVLFLLFYFVVLYHSQIYSQLFFQRLAQDALALANDTTTTVSFCLNQTYIVNRTSNATFEKVQTGANHFNMYNEVISLSAGSLMALLYGPLSDIVGRKPIFFVLFIAILLAGILQLVIVVFELNLYYNLLCMVVYGLGGGYATMSGVVFAAASDVTPKRWLAARMGILESCISFGTIMSFLIGYNWLQSDNCDFVPPVLLIIGTSIFCLVYLAFFPEPMKREKVRIDDGVNENRGFIKLLNGVKIFFIPIICNVLTGFVRKTWEMFVVGGFLSIRDIGFPVMRSMLALYVSPKLYGSVLTLASALEAVSSSGASILFNEVYHPEAVVNGHNINAGVIFWVSAGIWALNIPLIIILLYFDVRKAKVHKANPVRLVDEEKLLASNSNNYGATINQ
uniref:Major facilitator superfamily (MFS) profile domain-containing protein n=1 Tax=Amphimedon queenslandica TaxID=400682 RepID=A0A1X7VW36_AMPQE